MPRTGRPRKKIDWEEFEKLCALQCTLEEIASWFSCSVDTVERAVEREQKCTFAEYSSQKRGKGRISLRRVQYQAAMNGNTTMLIWLGKNMLGQSDTQKVELTGGEGGPVKTEVNYAFNHDQHAALYRQFVTRRSGGGTGEDGCGADPANDN